ncbi:hypothetical protein Tco_0353496 [Tanacetum coccineum]
MTRMYLLGIKYSRLNSVSNIVSSASTHVSTGRRVSIVSTVKSAYAEDIIVDGDLQEEAAPAGEQSSPPAPKTAKQLTAKRNNAKSLWAAIKSRFGGNDESKKMQRNVLKHQFENFTTAPNESLYKAYDRLSWQTYLLNLFFIAGSSQRRSEENLNSHRARPFNMNLHFTKFSLRDSDTESEDMAVAPTPDDHEQEAEANTVFAPGPTGRDKSTLTSPEFVTDLRSEIKVKITQAEWVYVGSSSSRLVKGEPRENKKLKMMLESTQRDFDRLSWHHHNLRQWSFEVQWHLHPFRHYRERPYVAPTALVAHVDRADPDDPSPRPTRRPRHDDPYVMVRDAAARNEGDDAATTSDPQPSQPPGSPHYHLIMPPRAMTQAAIEKLVSDRVAAALAQDRATRGNTNGAGGPGGNTRGNAGGQGGAPPARECTYSSFMKCNPTSFHGNEGAVELCRWFEKTESVFSISECAERNKVKFAAATLQGRALTWWNSQVATLGLEVANAKSWNDMKIMMREEFLRQKRYKNGQLNV